MIKSITIILTYIVLVGLTSFSSAQEDADRKIIISNKEEIYTYQLTKKGEVQVKAEYVINYKCINPSTVYFFEYYDNYSEIKNVKIKGIKGVSPQYGMYKEENIFFSDSKACYFEIPFIQKNSEATVTLNKTYKDIRRLGFLALAEPHYIQSGTIKVIVPDWIDIDLLLHNAAGKIKKDSIRDEANKTTTYSISITDQPEIVKEANSPSYTHSYPYITIVPKQSTIDGNVVKYFDTVDNLYQWYRQPLKDLDNNSPMIKDKSSELITNCNTDEEKIRNLSKWVQQNIRYVAFQNGISAFRPDEAQEVMAKKYGDCKGMSNLLKALLVSAGFDARLTWVATNIDGKNLNIEAPVPFADHMICSLFWNDSLYYIDPTVESLSFREIPEWIQGQKVLIEDGENYILSQIPEYNAKNNMDSLFMQYSLIGNKLGGKGYRCFKGESKHSILHWMKNLKESDKKNKIGEFLKRGEAQDSIFDIKIEGLDSFLSEVSIDYNTNIKSRINTFDNQTYIDLDDCKDYLNSKIDISKRKTPLKLPNKDYVVRISEFIVPDTYQVVLLPQEVAILRDKYSFVIAYKKEDRKIVYRKELTIFDPILDLSDFEQWNTDLDTLRKAYNELIVLEN